jgi:hypothetical protein
MKTMQKGFDRIAQLGYPQQIPDNQENRSDYLFLGVS